MLALFLVLASLGAVALLFGLLVKKEPDVPQAPSANAPAETAAASATDKAANNDSPPPPGAARLLERHEVVPGELRVEVYSNSIQTERGPLATWTYVSDGLWPLHQKEILFCVKREPGEAENGYDRRLLELYRTIHSLAKAGRLVDVGDSTELSAKAEPLLGRGDFRGVLYTRHQPVLGIETRAPSLTAVVVTSEEIAFRKSLGPTRILSRLGLATRYFPTPPWTDRKRASVVSPGEAEQSLLATSVRLPLAGVSVRLERKGGIGAASGKDSFFVRSDRLVLRVLPRGAKTLQKALASDAVKEGLLLLLESDPGADAGLVWTPGQPMPSAISAPGAVGARVFGSFLLIATGKSEPSATVFEDGFVLTMSDDAWRRARDAIGAGKDITIPGTDKVPSFSVEWISTVYVNPIDGSRLEAEDGWSQFVGEGDSASAATSPNAPSILLLTSDADIQRRTTVADLAGVIREIIRVVDTESAKVNDGSKSDLLVECEVRPNKQKTFRLAQRPAGPRALVDALSKGLPAIEAPDVKGPVRFQVQFKIRGGSGSGDWQAIASPEPL